jgi:hypothetical protein
MGVVTQTKLVRFESWLKAKAMPCCGHGNVFRGTMHQTFGIRTSFVLLRVQNDSIVRVLRLSRLTLSDCVAKS